ncbi:MAG TPA: hypothetical protein DCS13_08125 [Candidatus Margulisbacteria bacterium]|nr:MAG: hypothetical protein A2X43_14055 [Candidatus Margulisbacteria bacterium GWD2_39_127]HAR63414.1 hypothetical protein [Candidatus Margulisiibacteriota bacterium]
MEILRLLIKTYISNIPIITTSFIELLKIVIPSAITLFAGYIGIKYGLKQIEVKKHLDFIEKQLANFYSPILGYQKEIRAKSELRVKISHAAGVCWQDRCHGGHVVADPEYQKYIDITEYENKQFKNELLPLYKKMLSTFRDNYWLAETPTREWFKVLCEYIEKWDRYYAESIPKDVIRKIGLDESVLLPFYEELECTMNILRDKLKYRG